MVNRNVDKCIAEFEKFYDLLMSSPPDNYQPWFFPCQPYGKDPATDAIKAINWHSHGSWHHDSARLTKEQCIEHIKRGYNIGLSARDGDALVIIDIDNEKFLNQAPKDTLCVTSRKRCGLHAFCWASDKSVKINVPTNNGEIRSNDQYVLSCGSFVPFNLEKPHDQKDERAMKAWQKEKNAYDKLDDAIKDDEELGYYTIKNPIPPRPITYEEFPSFFLEKDLDNKATNEWVKLRTQFNSSGNNRYYDLHQLKMRDIVGDVKGRIGHPLHESDTDANFSLGEAGLLGHCWRHMVSLNAVQYLCVKAGYAKCEDAGTPHKKDMDSKLKGDKKALDVAYEQAVKDGLIKPNVEKGDRKPEITLPGTGKSGKLISTFANEIMPYIKDNNELFYRYREFSVQKLEKMPIKDIKKREIKILGFKTVVPSEFVTYIEDYITPGCYVKDKETDEFVFKYRSITRELANTLLDSAIVKRSLPLIDVLFEAPLPMLVDDKLVFPNKGYDERFQSWLPFDTPELNPDMKLDDALKIIEEIYSEFCFETPQDKTNTIAGLITPFIRGLYSRPTCRTPIFFYKANRERAGKDYCAEITGIVMQGVANSEPPLADGKETHDDEFRKKILATFRMGKNRLHMSNNRGFLNSAQLESISTNENFSDRILGSNTTLTFPNNLELSLSANTGITYTPDLANRCVFVNLFLALENPNERYFKKPDLHGWVKTNRGNILSALYALVRTWHEKGMPPGITPFASYPEWARVCGGIMVNADLGDPCVPNDDMENIGGDSETKDMKRLFEACFYMFGTTERPKKEILNLILGGQVEGLSDLFNYLDWSNEKSIRTKLGVLIDKYIKRELSGITMYRSFHAKPEDRRYRFVRTTSDEIIKKREGVPRDTKGYFWNPIDLEEKNKNSLVELSGKHPLGTPRYPLGLEQEASGGTKGYVELPQNKFNQQFYGSNSQEEIIDETDTPKHRDLKMQVLSYLTNVKKVIKICDLQVELDANFDEICEAVDKLKSEGEIMETPSGTVQKVW